MVQYVLKTVPKPEFTDGQNRMFIRLAKEIHEKCPDISPTKALNLIIQRYRSNFNDKIRKERQQLKKSKELKNE